MSDDGAGSWTAVFGDGPCDGSPSGLCPVGYVAAMTFDDEDNGIIWHADSTVYMTKSGGARWKSRRIARSRHSLLVKSVQQRSSEDIVAITSGYGITQLVRSKVGGRGWDVVRKWPWRISD